MPTDAVFGSDAPWPTSGACNRRRFSTAMGTRCGVGAMLLEAVGIEKVYRHGWRRRPQAAVLAGVDLALCPSEAVGVVGPSGAGKTTLGMVLAGILKPDRGMLRYGQTDLWACGRRRRRHLAQDLQMVFQHPETTFDPRWTLARSLAEAYVLRKARPTAEFNVSTGAGSPRDRRSIAL